MNSAHNPNDGSRTLDDYTVADLARTLVESYVDRQGCRHPDLDHSDSDAIIEKMRADLDGWQLADWANDALRLPGERERLEAAIRCEIAGGGQEQAQQILPAGGWHLNRETGEYWAVVGPVHATITPVVNEAGDCATIYWMRVAAGEGIEALRGYANLQAAARNAADAIAEYLLEDAAPAELIEIVQRRLVVTDRLSQTVIAQALGVTQPTVSGWLAGTHEMSGAVRAHIMRIAGIEPMPGSGEWAIYHR